jgi:protocatechuate 3,4-dioxygenase beta subunit
MGLIALACFALAPSANAYAQETINQATISGRVLDAQGAAVPGAAVSGRQTDTNVTVQAITDTDGRFRFPYLKMARTSWRRNSRDSKTTRARWS